MQVCCCPLNRHVAKEIYCPLLSKLGAQVYWDSQLLDKIYSKYATQVPLKSVRLLVVQYKVVIPKKVSEVSHDTGFVTPA